MTHAVVASVGARTELLALLRERAFARKRVVLASGKESDFFIDCKQAVLSAQGHRLVGELMLDAVRRLPTATAVAGVELGGCPLASAVALTSALHGPPLDAIIVRKEAKEHGSRRELEGNDRLAAGASIVVVEDVTTTGGSTLRAIEKIRRGGYRVVGVVTLVDRLEGGREAIEATGITVIPLFTRDDFLTAG